MLTVNVGNQPKKCCNGTSRRHALRLGACGLIGGFTLPRLLELQAKASLPGNQPKAKSCIFLFLFGGPPHQDMWDPKPEAQEEIRGPFKAISTSVPGTLVTDQLPRCAKMAEKFTIVRSHSHGDNGHTTGYHLLMTGRPPNFPDGELVIPNNEFYPSIGSVVSRTLGPRGAIPSYINIPHAMAAGGSGFYGAKHSPFVIESDPSQPDFAVKDLRPPPRLSKNRLNVREKMLAGIESLEREQQQGRAKAMSAYYEQAYNLMTSPEAKRAFDIQSEPAEVREAYGFNQFGQCALLSRRLIEAGCRFVGVDSPGWDVHFNCFPSLERELIPAADYAFSALITDLEERGLLDSTLVVMMGEMGRTPRINRSAGRDHWSQAQTIIMAGGGITPGRVIGATDKHASSVISDMVSVNDLLHSIYTLMGINPDSEYVGPLGRPIPILAGGKMIPGLI